MATEKAILAGGCFWGMQELFRREPGVVSTRVGYSGGNSPNATYHNHGNHAESIEVVYDLEKTDYRALLEFFFQVHDPTTRNRQGGDLGADYRSAVFYLNDEQKRVAEDTISDVEASGLWPGKVVTEVTEAGAFWEAEPEHQDYLQRYPDGYTCHYPRPNWKLPPRAVGTQAADSDEPETAHRRRLSPKVALYVLASVAVSFLAASSAPTPLYSTYQSTWHFTAVTTTVVFAVYAIAVLGALLLFGRLSDFLGRRPIVLAGIAVQVAALIVLCTATGVPELFVGRILQGLAAGVTLGAVGAGMLDIDRLRGTTANSVALGLGTATGAMLSALLVQFLPAPTHLVYLVLIGVLAMQTVAVSFIAETVSRSPGVRRALVPEIKLPRSVRGAMLTAAPVLFAVWALAGFFLSLGPGLVCILTKSQSAVYGGLAVFVFAGASCLAVLGLKSVAGRKVMVVGIAALVIGVALTLLSVQVASTPLFFVGVVMSGIGFGAGFQGGVRTVVPFVEPHERAGVLSVVYVISYLGFGLPAVIAGYFVVHSGGLVPVERIYGLAVIALALMALSRLVVRQMAGRRGSVRLEA